MSPRRPAEGVKERLVEVAARLLDEEGRDAVSARRVAAEAGVSTMAVYSHVGSMDELLAAVWREGFARFGQALAVTATRDPVADWIVQGWAYRHFALTYPHLYRTMFGPGVYESPLRTPEDAEASAATFGSLLALLTRCVGAGRFVLDDVFLAGEVVWAGVHGHVSIELVGYFTSFARRPEPTYAAVLAGLARAMGDDPALVARSARRARPRIQAG